MSTPPLAITGALGPQGTVGPKGAIGAAGTPGTPGAPGPAGVVGPYVIHLIAGKGVANIGSEDVPTLVVNAGDGLGLSADNVVAVAADGTITVSPAGIAVGVIGDANISFGTGAGQVEASDLPITDVGTFYTSTEVEGALQEIGTTLTTGVVTSVTAGSGLSDSGTATDPILDINDSPTNGLGTTADVLHVNVGDGLQITSDDVAALAADGTVVVNGSGIAVGVVGDSNIDFGTGAGQVSAGDVPIVDAGTYYVTDDVESALQQLTTSKQEALGFTPENVANKDAAVDLGGGGANNTEYPTQLAVKTYVDNLAVGLNWQQPVELINVVGEAVVDPTCTPGNNLDGYFVNAVWGGFAVGDLVQCQSGSWVLIKSMVPGDRFGVAFKSATTPTGGMTGQKNNLGVVDPGVPPYSYTFTVAANNDAVFVQNVNAFYHNVSFVFSTALTPDQWVQLSAAVDFSFASGLQTPGNVVSLGNLTTDWVQSGAFDVVLNNASSELRVLESAGGAFYGQLDVGDLTGDKTYTFPDEAGTVCISGGATCLMGFDQVTAGSNTSALVVDTGGSLTTSGSGTITATDLGCSSCVALGGETTGDYVATLTAGGGLTGDASGEGSAPTVAVVSSNGGIVVNADSIDLTVAPSADALSSTTNSGSGLEVLASGVALLQGCADTQILKWDETGDHWQCAPDEVGTAATLQSAYNNGATITTAAANPIAFTLTSGNFNVSGAGEVNLTPAAASQFTSGAALTLTGGAASTWKTSAGLLTLEGNSGLTLNTVTGNLTLQPAGSSTTATVQLGVGGAGSTTPDLLGLDVKSDAGDPAGANGKMYYSASTSKFRCFEGGAWKDCDTTGAATLQTAYNNGATITTAGATPIAFTLTSGSFNVTGAGAVNLTPTAASQFTSSGALTLTGGAASTWSTTTGGLTITSAAGATWKTSAGTLTLEGNSGMTIDSVTGNITLQPAGSGTSATLQLGVDGAGSTTPDLLGLDVKSDAGDPAGSNGKMYYSASTSKFRCFENGAWANCIERTLVTLGADVTNATTAYANVTGLAFPVTSGTLTSFQCTIYFTTNATTTGSRWSINGPATTALMYQSEYTLTATTSTRNAMVQAYDSPGAANATSAAGANLAVISGYVLPSASGTVTVRDASEVAVAGGNVAKAGSKCEYY
ncbi:MAG: hypothetical protein U0514_02375 [Candidatus Andersenbacteria bacterium]